MWRSALARLAMLGIAAIMLGGCTSASFDARTFESTIDRPLTYTLYAGMTDKSAVLWTKDIPVNHKLLVDLDRPNDFELFKTNPNKNPHKMRWTLLTINESRLVDKGRMDLPNVRVYQELTLRPAPEFPEDFDFPGLQGEDGAIEVEIIDAADNGDEEAVEPEAEEEQSENQPDGEDTAEGE